MRGWALHGGVFAPLVERLSDRFELHVVHLPGHGRSRDCVVPLTLQACVDAICARTPTDTCARDFAPPMPRVD